MKAGEPRLFLASGSPRRREILQQMGLRHELVKQSVDEAWQAGETAEAYVQRLAAEKAEAGLRSLTERDNILVLGADTAVLCQDRVLGKPRDREDAVETLKLLSGRRHRVVTAVAITDGRICQSVLSSTSVEFRSLGEAEMRAYWETAEPRDKAGAYAIQGLGALFVKKIEGSYSAVVGLPIYETARLLHGFGLDLSTLLANSRASGQTAGSDQYNDK